MTSGSLRVYLLDNLGGFVTLTVLISAAIACHFVSENKVKDENKVKVLISSKDSDRIFKKASKVGLALWFTCMTVGFFFGRGLANISPYLFGFLFLITMFSVLIDQFSRHFMDRERIDMPRPIFRVLGLFILLIFIVLTYLSGIEIAKDIQAGRE